MKNRKTISLTEDQAEMMNSETRRTHTHDVQQEEAQLVDCSNDVQPLYIPLTGIDLIIIFVYIGLVTLMLIIMARRS